MGALARLRRRVERQVRRQVRSVPRRGRRAARIVITYAETALAVRRHARARHEEALDLLHDAARRSPADMRVARLRSQVLARTGRMSDALTEASRLALEVPDPRNRRLQRSLQGRWTETDPGWAPVVPSLGPTGPTGAEAGPVAGRVLYLAKESMPYRNNGYCTRTHETLLAVRAAGRDPVAVTLPGFPSGPEPSGPAAEPTSRGSRLSRVDDIEYHHVLPGAAPMLRGVTYEEYVQLTTTAFARQVRRVRPEVLHAGSGHRGYDIALVGRALAAWAGRPWIYEVRSFFETTWTADQRYAENAEYYHRRFAAESRAMGAADAVVTLSGPMRDEIVDGHGIDPDRVFVVPNAVDLDRFGPLERDLELRRRLGLEGTFVLGYVSNLDHYREGQEVLLEAAARLRATGRAVSVLLVGDGRRRAELEERARALGLGAACVFAGSVPFDEVPAWYAQIDLFVVPRVPERAGRMVSPMKPFEAMAMEIPVLVSDLPALLEIAGPHEERAFVFAAADPAALAARVDALIDAPAVRAGRAAAAGSWVRAERTWAANGKAFDQVYSFAGDVFAARGGPVPPDARPESTC
jgi:phosphatidyl-myo-inositol dimannoside synthase